MRSGGTIHAWGETSAPFLDDAACASFAKDRRQRFARFAEFLGDRLSSSARAIYARVLDALDQWVIPARLYSPCTLVHGDAHVWNLLYPRDGVDSRIRLIDWASWRVGRGTSDLSYMMAVHWYPERRARLEAPLLERYHAALCTGGVTGYERDQLWTDYRKAVLGGLLIPVWQQSFGFHPSIWWPHLNRLLAAVEDLDCAALLR
jgi:aminoglycoside phosphotransferase (APT) family kinase protein